MSSSSSQAKAKKAPKAPKVKKTFTYAAPKSSGLVLASVPDGGVYIPKARPTAYSDTRSFTSGYQKASPELQALVDTVLDPDSVDAGARWPNSFGLSSVYKSVNTINAQFDKDAQSMVAVHPRLSNAIFSTAGDVYTQALVPVGTNLGNFLFQKVAINSNSVPVCPITAPWFFNNSHVALPQPANVPAGSTNFLYPIGWNSTDATAVLTMQFSGVVPADVGLFTVRIRWYDATLAQTHIVNLVLPAGGTVNQTLNPVVATNVTYYMSIELVQAFQPYEGTVTVQLKEVGGAPALNVILDNTYTHCIASNLNGATTISNSSEEYFVTAQSLLCTFQGSSLNNGGLISTARVPGDTALGEKTDPGAEAAAGGSSVYGWLASLQNNRYDGKLKNGSYTWYLGDSEEDYFYRPVQEFLDDLPYMVAAFSTTDTGPNIVRIKVVTHVMFKSNSNVYSQLPSPYMRDIAMLPHILSLVNSSYSNDGHKGGLKESLKGIGKQVGKMLMSPKTWITAAELLAMLL